MFKGSFRLERSRAERSKDRNKATAVITKLQRSNALICFTKHTSKRIEMKLYHATLRKSVNEPLGVTLAKICIIFVTLSLYLCNSKLSRVNQ